MNEVTIEQDLKTSKKILRRYYFFQWKKMHIQHIFWKTFYPTLIILVLLGLLLHHSFLFSLGISLLFVYASYQLISFVQYFISMRKGVYAFQKDPYTLKYSDKSLIYSGENFTSEIMWEYFKSYSLNKKEIYLFINQRESPIILSEEYLRKEHFERLKEIIQQEFSLRRT